MDPNTGKIDMYHNEEEAKAKGHVIILRKLHKYERQAMQISLYSPCGCGSGKKFKFCCWTGARPRR